VNVNRQEGVVMRTTSNIISLDILDRGTGEITPTSFKQIKASTGLKGGFNMLYHKSYEEVTESAIKSNTDMKVFNWITNRFTYQKVDVPLAFTECDIKISQPQFTRLVKRLVELDYLRRTSRGIYRLNPFIYVPYKANGAELQKEWIAIETG